MDIGRSRRERLRPSDTGGVGDSDRNDTSSREGLASLKLTKKDFAAGDEENGSTSSEMSTGLVALSTVFQCLFHRRRTRRYDVLAFFRIV